MNYRHRFLMLLLLLLSGQCVTAQQAGPVLLEPWRFQMTVQEVMSFTQYAPYKSFSNGDLETYEGLYRGKKENVQFFFKDNHLIRLSVGRYEGTDLTEAAAAMGRAYDELRQDYGDVELPSFNLDSSKGAPSSQDVAARARAMVESTGIAQMAPLKQPPGLFTYVSFRYADVQGESFYYVTVFRDPPRAR